MPRAKALSRHGSRRYAFGHTTSDRLQGSALRDYLVIYEQAEDGGWGAHSPDVDGVYALGKTRKEVEARMAEALTAAFEYFRDEGMPIPEPHTEAGRVAAA